jgi:hypothetical protein
MWDPNISQPYRPPRPVTGIAMFTKTGKQHIEEEK